MSEEKNEDQVEDGAEDAVENEGGEAKASSKKKLLVLLVPLLLIAGGAGAYFTGALDSVLGGGKEQAVAAADAGHGEESAADGHGAPAGDGHGGGVAGGPVFLVMPPQRVNLNSDGGPTAYLQLGVQFELASEADKMTVESLMPRIIDQFQTYLRELRVRDLEGTAGFYRLQVELIDRVNSVAAPVEVKDVLFQEILIQEE